MKAKDALMRTFGSKSSVKGKVISVAKTKWRVEWTIREATIVLDHGKAFWKPKITPPTNGDVGSVSGPVVENDRLEEEDDRGDHEMEAARDDDNEGHEEGEDEANDPLKCKLGGEFLKWEKLNSGVIVDQRAKDGWGNKFFRVHWPRETAHQEHKTEEECRNLLFPVHWLMVHWKKKRAKRRAKYLEIRDVLESARASYKADQEKKRTAERERYQAEPEEKQTLNASGIMQTQKRNGHQLNAKAIKQSQKRNRPLNASGIKQTQKRNRPLNANVIKQTQKRNGPLKETLLGES
ncbi:hypothetical protein EMCRGX_G001777 [Ephydatia muelleri]